MSLSRGLVPPLVIALLLAGCAAAPLPRLEPTAGLELWQVPASAFGTQRLYRAHYDGPQGNGGLRITLRLAAADRYSAQAVDRLGRSLWAIDIDGERGLWLDYRHDVACHLAGEFDLAGLPLSPLPLEAFPALLLGRLPVPPAAEPRHRGHALVFRDAWGRRWEVMASGDQVSSWRVSRDGHPIGWWMWKDGEAILSDREGGSQLRWREVVAEPLAGEPPPLNVPTGFREAACRDLEVPAAGGTGDGGGEFDSPPAPL